MLAIQDVLHPFGITRRYKGSKYVAYAISLVVRNDTRLEAVVKEIYMETASHFDCHWTTVERDIRTVVFRAWRINSKLLSQMAGYTLPAPPTNSDFIAILSSYIQRSQ